MKMSSFTITILSILAVSGCDIAVDSCDPSSPLYPGLTPEQLEECEDGESGGEPDLTGEIVGVDGAGEMNFQVYSILSTAEPGVLALWDMYVGDSDISYEVTDSGSCAETGPLIHHVPGWGTPVGGGFSTRMDTYCGDGQMGHAVDSSRWSLCRDHSDGLSDFRPGESRYYPAEESYTAQGQDIIGDDHWTEVASCREPSDNPASFCDLGMVSVGDVALGGRACVTAVTAPARPALSVMRGSMSRVSTRCQRCARGAARTGSL
jgi:hypothetical protein